MYLKITLRLHVLHSHGLEAQTINLPPGAYDALAEAHPAAAVDGKLFGLRVVETAELQNWQFTLGPLTERRGAD